MRYKWSKFVNRIIALTLSASTLASYTTVSAGYKDKAKSFAQKHPVITSGVAITGASVLLASAVVSAVKLNELIGTLRVHTSVIDIPNKEIQDYLDAQIIKFENHGKHNGTELFAVSDKIICEADPHVLALILNTFNTVFDEKPFLAEVLKEKLVRYNSYFCIDWCNDKECKSFCRLFTDVLLINSPNRFEINKNYGRSLYKTKKLMRNDNLAVQKQVIAALGKFLDECCIKKSQRLNIKSVLASGRLKEAEFDKKYADEVLNRFNYHPFGTLLADYVLKTRSSEDILMKIFKEYLDSLEQNWKNDKAMFDNN